MSGCSSNAVANADFALLRHVVLVLHGFQAN